MPRADDGGHVLWIKALRGGPVSEITAFLIDVSDAYNALYWFNATPPELGRAGLLFPMSGPGQIEQIVPDDQLLLNRVSIRSPGFWEFLGAINPVQQLRLWLDDRHKRRQDREYREASEKERLRLDNEALQQTIFRSRLDTIREFGGADMAERVLWADCVEKPPKRARSKFSHLRGNSPYQRRLCPQSA